MKIYEVSKLCKKKKELYYFEHDEELWAGVSQAAYCLYGFPKIDEEQLERIFDVPTDKNGMAEFKALKISSPINRAAFTKKAFPIACKFACISGYIPFKCGDDTFFIAEKYFKPLGAIDRLSQLIFELSDDDESPSALISDGLLPVAVISLERDLIKQEVVDEFDKFADRLALALALQEKRQSAQKEKPQSEDQMSIEGD